VSERFELTRERARALARLVGALVAQRGARRPGAEQVAIREVEVLVSGRPAVLDVLAQVGGQDLHAVLGVRRPGVEQHFLRPREEGVLGLLDDGLGTGVVVDALGDADMVQLLLGAVTGDPPRDEAVVPLGDDDERVTVAVGDRCTLTVFSVVHDGPHPGVELLVGLDEAGFNHLAAPLARWRRGGRDLGVVQELLVGAADGRAVALTSLRDLYASGGRPEDAGGDFGPEADALGTMTARMHLALEQAFGTEPCDVAAWAEQVEVSARERQPQLLDDGDAAMALRRVKATVPRLPAIRTHGDFNLGRTSRTDHGWIVADTMPGGRPPGALAARPRLPLADVADMLWSLHQVAVSAAAERDPTGQGGLASLAQAWEAHNGAALVDGYLTTQHIDRLVPADRGLVDALLGVLAIEQALAHLSGD